MRIFIITKVEELLQTRTASVTFTGDERGMMHPDGVLDCIKSDDVHYPKSRVLALENTSNKGGGTCYQWEEIEALRAVASKYGLTFHLDGARPI